MAVMKQLLIGIVMAFSGLVLLVLGPVVTTSTAEIGKQVVTNVNSSASTTGIDDVNETGIDTFKMFASFLMLGGIVTIAASFIDLKKTFRI